MSHSTVFGNRDFLLLWSGNAASHIGLHGARLAYPLLALILTDSPASASWVAFAIAVPSIVFEVPAGVISDFWDRRSILILCQRTGLVATLLAGAVIILRPPGLTLFLAMAAFVECMAYIFFNASELGLIRDVISEGERPAAFAFLEAEQPIANMAGRALGAAALGLARSLPFLANAASYLFCLWTLSKISERGRAQSISARPARIWEWTHVSAGIRALWSDVFLRQATAIFTATNAIFQIFIVLIAVVLRGGGHPAWVVGMVLGASGLGGLFGAAPAAIFGTRVGPRLVVAASLWAWTPLFMLIVVSTNPMLIAIGWAGAGFVGVAGNVALTLYRVRAFPEELIGRIYSAIKLLSHGGTAVGALLSGVLLSALGPTATGWLLVVVTIVLARRARHIPDPGPPLAPPLITSPPALPSGPAQAPRPANWIAGLSRTVSNPEGHQGD
ncbi:MFS transporter [Nocardia tengchongensis]|uniref:MFS transporter n=1 Tax=Nocardia tengchongensis TaxID=2055889 RepID=UPI0036BCB9DD